MKNLRYVLMIGMLLVGAVVNAQIQKGIDIDGEAAQDRSGTSVSMPDANTMAIGAWANGGNGSTSGHVRIYTWNGTSWVQKGLDIDGEAAGDYSGNAVSMPDSNTVAIAAKGNDGNGSYSGHVRIYTWNDTAWVQKGLDIDGEAAGDYSGYSLSMPDSNTVAIGARQNHGNGSHSGHVRIYNWNGSFWVQKGIDIDGKAAGDESGWAVSMPDSNTVAIGAPGNFPFTTDSGRVRIYAWNGIDWVQKGMDIDGEAAKDGSGCSVSMPDANTVAIGAPFNDGNGYYSGHVRIYTWNDTAWVQKGIDIDGEADDFSGISVSMPDSNNVAIGAYGNGTNAGQVRIYTWNGTVWVKKGLDINGEAAEDHSGSAISMPDANTVAIGAPFNDGNGSDAGHVRVYTSFCKTDSILSVNSCDSTYTSPSGNYLWSQSGTYMDTITNTAGCDSIITIYLTFITVDTFVINLSPHLIANAIPASYQWLDCNNAMTPIIGQTYQSYIATANGSYAVEITQDGCVDTSACQLVNNIGIQKNDFDDALSIYPNPTQGKITIKCKKMERVEVVDITGKVLYEQLVSSDAAEIDISAFSKGVYFVKVFSAEGVGVERVVLE